MPSLSVIFRYFSQYGCGLLLFNVIILFLA